MIDRVLSVVVLVSVLATCGCQTKQPAAVPEGPSVAQPAVTEILPAPSDPQPTALAWYEAEIRAFEAADKAAPPMPGQALFIGSSSVRMWTTLAEDMAPAPVLNRGFGGSKTGDVLAVFDRIVLPYKPSIIVYYCGDNDLGMNNTDSQAVANGFVAFDQLARAQWPQVKVFYIAIKPSVQRWSNWPAMQKANDLVRAYCERTPGASYLDIVSPALTPAGQPDPSIFREDGLHLNAKGYAIWKRVIREPVVEAWMGRKN